MRLLQQGTCHQVGREEGLFLQRQRAKRLEESIDQLPSVLALSAWILVAVAACARPAAQSRSPLPMSQFSRWLSMDRDSAAPSFSRIGKSDMRGEN